MLDRRLLQIVIGAAILLQILDRPPESEASCQTDLFLDRPETPVYFPNMVGLDVETQIYPGDVSLFVTADVCTSNITDFLGLILFHIHVGLWGCITVWTYRQIPTFRTNLLPSSSESKI